MNVRASSQSSDLVWVGHPWIGHTVSMRTVLVVGAAMILIWLEFRYGIAWQTHFGVQNVLWTAIAAAAFLIILLVPPLSKRQSHEYILHKDSLEFKSGIVGRKSVVFSPIDFSNLELRQSFSQRAIGIGDITVKFNRGHEVTMKSIRSPTAVSGMIREVMTKPRVALVPEITTTTREKMRDEGKQSETKESAWTCLVKNDVEKAFRVFAGRIAAGREGLCITREPPSRIRRMYGLKNTRIVWLTGEKVEGETTLSSLQDLSILIGDFLAKAERSVVLLDGFEYLVVNHGFDAFIRFLQLTRTRFEQREATLIAPIIDETLSMKEVRLIEREMGFVATEKTV